MTSIKRIQRLFKYSVDILDQKGAPNWLRNHPVLKNKPKIKKIFPHIGLNSFREEVKLEINQIDKRKIVEDVLNEISSTIISLRVTIATWSDELEYDYPRNEHKEIVSKLNNFHKILYTLSTVIVRSIYSNDELTLIDEVKEGTYHFRKGEKIFRVYGKIKKIYSELCNESPIKTYCNHSMPDINNIPEVKKYNNLLGDNKYYIVFNSDDNGTWDVCTMSMRGITSCQSWDYETEGDRKPLQNALIGSILSKYIGIIYLTSGSKMVLGEKMLKRCVVKFVTHKNTKIPYIVIDRMYDSYDTSIMKLFVDTLQKHTHVKVLDYATAYASNNDEDQPIPKEDLKLPPENEIEDLDDHELPYQDTPFQRKQNLRKEYPKEENRYLTQEKKTEAIKEKKMDAINSFNNNLMTIGFKIERHTKNLIGWNTNIVTSHTIKGCDNIFQTIRRLIYNSNTWKNNFDPNFIKRFIFKKVNNKIEIIKNKLHDTDQDHVWSFLFDDFFDSLDFSKRFNLNIENVESMINTLNAYQNSLSLYLLEESE